MHGLVPSRVGDGGLHDGEIRHDIVKAGAPSIRCGLGDDGRIRWTVRSTAVGVREIGNATRIGDALNKIGL